MGSILATPSNALFGLSKCEKVKKEILTKQVLEKKYVKDWNEYAGKYSIQFPWHVNAQIQKDWIRLVNLEVKMYSLAKNNPKCFSITQNEYAKKYYNYWKNEQMTNKFYPNSYNGEKDYGYLKINWDSIYNQ